jgi:hypothetical protein
MYGGHGGVTKTMQQLWLAGVTWPGLPVTLGRNDGVVVFVDKLSRMIELVPCKKAIDAFAFAAIFVHNIVVRYGVPEVIISDKDYGFTAVYLSMVMELLAQSKL